MLLIEKVIKLLDDFHYEAFRQHLKNVSKRSYYPLLLVDSIDRHLMMEQDPTKLCKEVYDEVSDKARKKFNQLTHHTFKMTSFLAQNYPDYLLPNINRIQRLINTGKVNDALQLADLMQEVCLKIEDYQTERKLLQIQSQLNHLFESTYYSIKQQERMLEVMTYEQDFIIITNYYFTHLDIKAKIKKEDTDKHANFFKQYLKHPVTSIRLMSTYYYCFTFYLTKDYRFYQEEKYEIIQCLEKELKKYNYIVFPYLTNLLPVVRLLKIYFLMQHLDSKSLIHEAENLLVEKDTPLYLKTLINLPELFSLAIQSSHYKDHYSKGFRKDRDGFISSEITDKLSFLKERCQDFLNNEFIEERFTMRFINLKIIYSTLLICGNKEEIKQGIATLEQTMMAYQQVSFHLLRDIIYSALITGYFCLEKFDRVEEAFKRYKKGTKNKVIVSKNNRTIHGFYYISKWLETGRKQYTQKFNAVLKSTEKENLNSANRILQELADYYKLPTPQKKQEELTIFEN